MDRLPYQQSFTVNSVPAWLCPTCRAGHLTLDKKHFLKKETARSQKWHVHPDFEPDWVEHVFSCTFICNNLNCKEPITCSGTGSAAEIEYFDDELGWIRGVADTFTPKYFDPPLLQIDIPDKCPLTVVIHLKKSFALFFADPGASLNCARAAVESLLTNLKVKRFSKSSGKPRRLLSLHQRILALPTKFDSLRDHLLAVKWLGNAGSHDGDTPSASDVQIVYDLLEHVLAEIYEDRSEKLKAIAKKVIKKKGPI